MLLSIHQNTSRAAGYRGSLEGWAKAGIQYVELTDRLLEGFLENDTLPAARRVLTDLGLTPVSAAAVLSDIWIPGPARAASLETWRRRCDQFSSLGLQKIYSPSTTRRRVTAEDFAATPDSIREAGEIAREYNLTAMIEFTRTSTHLATLTSSLEVIREAAHPNVRPMLDFFHFWSGLSKFEDLDLLQLGELAHAHFQDLLDTPRELIDNDSRLIPGDGIAPVVRILQKLAEKHYAGALSVEIVPGGAGEGGSIPGRHRNPPEVRSRDAPGTGLVGGLRPPSFKQGSSESRWAGFFRTSGWLSA